MARSSGARHDSQCRIHCGLSRPHRAVPARDSGPASGADYGGVLSRRCYSHDALPPAGIAALADAGVRFRICERLGNRMAAAPHGNPTAQFHSVARVPVPNPVAADVILIYDLRFTIFDLMDDGWREERHGSGNHKSYIINHKFNRRLLTSA